MKLLKSFSLYTFVGFLNAGISFLLLPILTKYLSPVDYGFIALINTYVSILLPIMGMSVGGYIGIEYYSKENDRQQFRSLFSSVQLIPVLIALPLGALLFTFTPFFSRLLELPSFGCYILIPLSLTVVYQDQFSAFLIISKRSLLFGFASLSKLLIEIPLTILLIVYIGMHWEGRIYAWAIVSGLMAAISVYAYFKWDLISSGIKKEYITAAFLFGTPLILHQIGKFIIDQSDRLFIAKMISVEEMGIYSVGYQVGMIIMIVITAFSNFFSPFLLESLNKITEQKKIEIVKISYGFITLLFISLIGLSLLTPFLFTYFISEEFKKGAEYVFWVGLGFCFWGIYMVFVGYIFYLKRSKILGYLAVLNVSINIVCNYFFIQIFGAIGAAYATCLSYAIVGIVVAFVAQKLYPMPWFDFGKIFKSSVLR
jgi:O-antigen/teichoic acid export membrane protein